MEVVSNNYMPGDPRLVQQLVYELKSQGIFDQFRKECISDVDTKPAYQNLRQRVEGSVTTFLKQQTWRPDMNKNQVREQLRKSIYESGYLETGVERIVDQVVNPKINTVFLPQVEDVVYRYLGIEKPNQIKKELKIDVTDLLPTDLEAVSPESDHTKEDSLNLNDSNVDSKLEEDESPPFEPLDVQPSDVQQHEDNSVDSHLSGFSGLQSHDSNPCNDTKICQVELSNQDSQVSQNSSESHLSIVTSEENTKMEICGESESKLLQSIIVEEKIDISIEIQGSCDKDTFQKDTEEPKKAGKIEEERKEDKTCDDEKKTEDKKMLVRQNDDKKSEEKRTEDRKHNERKNDDKKSRSSEKHSSKDRKDDKYKKSSSNSSSRDKDKSSSRHSSSASSKDKDKSKEKKESKTSISNSKDKVEKDKDKPEKDRSEKEKSKSEKDRDRGDREKSKGSSSSSSKHGSNKDKDKSYSSSRKESSGKDKDKSRSSSSSISKDGKSKSSHGESKSSKSSTDKHKKDEKSSHNGKHSRSSSSLKKDKDKKRDSKKESKDDHYSSKEKKNDRRSTDRDSNDGQSSKQSQSNSFTENSSNTQKNSQESSNSNSGSGSGDSGNSDQIEYKKVITPIKLSNAIENNEVASTCADIQKLKYIKPKFASNFEEARKLMKIRKQLAKLERQNQLSLTQIEVSVEVPTTINGLSVTYPEENISKEVEETVADSDHEEPHTPELKEMISPPKDVTPMLQSTELSKENWEALEARLAQEMSNVNYNSYESPYDYDYDYAGYNSIVISPRKNIVTNKKSIVQDEKSDVTQESSKICRLDFEKKEDVISEKSENISVEPIKSEIQEVPLKKYPKNELEKSRKLRVELESSIYTSSKGVVKIIKREQTTKNGDKHKVGVIGVQQIVEGNEFCTKKDDKINCDQGVTCKNEEEWENVSDCEYECRYLEAPSASLEKNLQFIKRYIEKLEREVEHSVKAFQNNFLPLKRVGIKRKLENVDFKNNNKALYQQTTTETKRRRLLAPNPNSVISQANKEKVCNSTDISPNDSFSLPLSPAESDKSNDKKEDESPKITKQKRNVIGRNTSTRSQRYSSDDLYKPRPVIIATTRRSRGAKNPGT